MQDYIPRKIDINEQLPTVVVKQFDNLSRFIHVQIFDNDLPDLSDDEKYFNLENCTARLYVQPKGDDSGEDVAYIDGEVADGEIGIVTFLLPSSITETAGNYEGEIWIYGAETSRPIISTKPFDFVVEKSIRNNTAIEGTSKFTALDNALNAVGDIENDFTAMNQRIDYLSNYVTPEMFGAVGDGVTNDSAAFQACFDYVNSKYTAEIGTGEGGRINNGVAPVVCLHAGKRYYLAEEVFVRSPHFTLHGNNSVIKGNFTYPLLHFTASPKGGWVTKIIETQFVGGNCAIKSEYFNVETGSIIISGCRFYDTKGFALDLDHQSAIGRVQNCEFQGCHKVLKVGHVDRFYFTENWVGGTYPTADEWSPIECHSTQTFTMDNNLLVPSERRGFNDMAWVTTFNNCSLIAHNNRFGGEPGALPIVNVKTNINDPHQNQYQPGVIIKDNVASSNISGYCLIRMFTLPAFIVIDSCSPFYDNTTYAVWAESTTEDQQAEYIANRTPIIRLMNNCGINLYNKIKAMPENLRRYIKSNDYTPTPRSNNNVMPLVSIDIIAQNNINKEIHILLDANGTRLKKFSFIASIAFNPNIAGSSLYCEHSLFVFGLHTYLDEIHNVIVEDEPFLKQLYTSKSGELEYFDISYEATENYDKGTFIITEKAGRNILIENIKIVGCDTISDF